MSSIVSRLQSDRDGARVRRARSQFMFDEGLDQACIAELSSAVIERLGCDELVRVIRATDLATRFRPDLSPRLPFYDRETLQRLAFLARRCCQHSVDESVG